LRLTTSRWTASLARLISKPQVAAVRYHVFVTVWSGPSSIACVSSSMRVRRRSIPFSLMLACIVRLLRCHLHSNLLVIAGRLHVVAVRAILQQIMFWPDRRLPTKEVTLSLLVRNLAFFFFFFFSFPFALIYGTRRHNLSFATGSRTLYCGKRTASHSATV